MHFPYHYFEVQLYWNTIYSLQLQYVLLYSGLDYNYNVCDTACEFGFTVYSTACFTFTVAGPETWEQRGSPFGHLRLLKEARQSALSNTVWVNQITSIHVLLLGKWGLPGSEAETKQRPGIWNPPHPDLTAYSTGKLSSTGTRTKNYYYYQIHQI